MNITKRDTSVKHNNENKKRQARAAAIVQSDGIDMTVPIMQPDQMSKFDSALRKFNYSQALDLVLVHAVAFKKPHITVYVFDELCRYKYNFIIFTYFKIQSILLYWGTSVACYLSQ